MKIKSLLYPGISSLERMLNNRGAIYRMAHGAWKLLPGTEETSNQRFRSLLDHFLANSGLNEVVVLQVGAYDGKTGDPIHPYLMCDSRWRGVLIEPHQAAFARLQTTYRKQSRLQLVNCAITETNRSTKLYCPETFRSWDWRNQAASLSQKAFAQAARGIMNDHSVTIQGRTLSSVALECNLDRIDVACVDTEGSDAAVVQQILASGYRPTLLSWESWLVADDVQLMLTSLLHSLGYKIVESSPDTFALKTSYMDVVRTELS